jgi:hypothetical protein
MSEARKTAIDILLSLLFFFGIAVFIVSLVIRLSGGGQTSTVVAGLSLAVSVILFILHRRIVTPDAPSRAARSRRSAGAVGIFIGLIVCAETWRGLPGEGLVAFAIGVLFFGAGLAALLKKPSSANPPPSDPPPPNP